MVLIGAREYSVDCKVPLRIGSLSFTLCAVRMERSSSDFAARLDAATICDIRRLRIC